MAGPGRILFWADSFWPAIGGMETWAARYVVSLRERGFEVTVATTHAGFEAADHEIFRGIPVYRLPLWSALKSGNPGAILRARQAVAALRESVAPHSVHVNPCGPTTAFYLWTRHVAPAPTLFTLHGTWPDRYAVPGSLLARALESAHQVVAVSRSTRDWALAFAPHVAPRMQVIFPATDPRPAAPPSASATLLCIGRLSREKGFDLAIAAFARVHRQYPAARLIIAGHGPERERLARLASELGVADEVEFTGWVNPSEVSALIERAAVVVAPSRQEGFGLVALEAAHMGRPVAGFAVGGLKEVVVSNETGLLAAPEDSDALAGQLARLLGDPGFARRLGLAARRRARAEFLWETHMDRYVRTLDTLHGAGPGRAAGGDICA